MGKLSVFRERHYRRKQQDRRPVSRSKKGGRSLDSGENTHHSTPVLPFPPNRRYFGDPYAEMPWSARLYHTIRFSRSSVGAGWESCSGQLLWLFSRRSGTVSYSNLAVIDFLSGLRNLVGRSTSSCSSSFPENCLSTGTPGIRIEDGEYPLCYKTSSKLTIRLQFNILAFPTN